MQIQSPFQVTFDIQSHRTFADYFFSSISDYGTKLALVDSEGGKNWRYSEIRQWVDRCGQKLKEIGVTPGNSCIALVCSTNPLAIFVHLAVAQLGCRVVLINCGLSVDELWQQVDISEANFCVVETQFAQKLDDVRRKALMRGSGRIRVIRRLEEVAGDIPLTTLQKRESRTQLPSQLKESETDSSINETMSCSTVIMREKKLVNQTDSQEESMYQSGSEIDKVNAFLIMFSSGTAAPRLPKPVQITHQTLIANFQRLRSPIYGPLSANDRFLMTLCFSSVYGFYSAYYSLLSGAELYMIRKCTNKGFLKSLVDYKISHVSVTPIMLQFLANDLSLENVNLKPHLKSIISSGSPLDARIARQCKERLGIRDIRQIYGTTEMGGPALFSHFGCDNIESVGRPLPGVMAKIVQWDSKKLCGPRQPGHLLITGTNIYANIYRNSKATSDLLTNDGYVKTGDAAFYDESGCIYVMDRVKDIIKYRGTLICPSDVESTLRSHPGIEDCAVVGRQDNVAGEVPAAFVVKRSSHLMLSTSEIRQHVSGKIPQFKELRGGVFFLSEIPRSVCGKILRQNLRQHWDRERMGSKAEINGTVAIINSNNQRKQSKTAEELAKSKRSASISLSTKAKVVRPIARQYRQKSNNRSTD